MMDCACGAIIRINVIHRVEASMDWSQCPDVESVPDRLSGAWVVKGTRAQADAIVENAREGFSAEEIVDEIFPTVPLERATRILEFARLHEAQSA